MEWYEDRAAAVAAADKSATERAFEVGEVGDNYPNGQFLVAEPWIAARLRDEGDQVRQIWPPEDRASLTDVLRAEPDVVAWFGDRVEFPKYMEIAWAIAEDLQSPTFPEFGADKSACAKAYERVVRWANRQKRRR